MYCLITQPGTDFLGNKSLFAMIIRGQIDQHIPLVRQIKCHSLRRNSLDTKTRANMKGLPSEKRITFDMGMSPSRFSSFAGTKQKDCMLILSFMIVHPNSDGRAPEM